MSLIWAAEVLGVGILRGGGRRAKASTASPHSFCPSCAGGANQRRLASRASRASWTSRSQLSSTAARSRSHRQSNALVSLYFSHSAIVPRALHRLCPHLSPQQRLLVTTHEQQHPLPPPPPAHTHPPQPITRLRPRDHHPKWTSLAASRCRHSAIPHTACYLQSIRVKQ
jgi:hypothetical protein